MAPAATTTTSQSEREQLRSTRKLRPLNDDEQGNSIDLIAGGVFGFTYSPATEGVPLFGKPTFQAFEVHKLFSGSIEYIGFMTPADAQAVESPAVQTTELRLYPEPFEQAQAFVSVPRDRILKAKPPSREQGNWMGFLCRPKG